jgi:hypothetical protein
MCFYKAKQSAKILAKDVERIFLKIHAKQDKMELQKMQNKKGYKS